MKPIEIGDPAPNFTATDSNGNTFSLDGFRGKPVVVYFYPHDNTPVCTAEACAFRDAYEEFTKNGAEVIGISSDSDESHRAFAQTHRLPFRLVADPNGTLRSLFGVPKSMFVLPGRVTYVIDRNGIVRQMFNSLFEGARHVQEAIQTLRQLQDSPV